MGNCAGTVVTACDGESVVVVPGEPGSIRSAEGLGCDRAQDRVVSFACGPSADMTYVGMKFQRTDGSSVRVALPMEVFVELMAASATTWQLWNEQAKKAVAGDVGGLTTS